MIIKRYKWRALLGLPSWSIKGEWLEELNKPIPSAGKGVNTASWTGLYTTYEWDNDVWDWLLSQPKGSWGTSNGSQGNSDWDNDVQARIWLRKSSQATLFKLVFGGKQMPEVIRRQRNRIGATRHTK